MRPFFYLKIFLTFLLFFALLLSFTFYSFHTHHNYYTDKSDENRVNNILNNQEDRVINYLNRYQEKLNIFEKVINKYEEYEQRRDFLKETFFEDRAILEFKSIGFDSKDRFVIENSEKNIIKLKTNYTSNYFKTLRALKEQDKYIFIDEKDKRIINFAIRDKSEFFILKVDLNDFIDKTEKIYQNDSFIVVENINSKDSYTDYKSKKIYINEDEFFHIFVKQERDIFNEFFAKNFLNISLTSIFLSILFSIFAILIIAKESKRIELTNKELDIENQRNSKRLDKNFEIMDRYILYIRVNNQGIITDVSSAFCSLLGFSRSELVGHRYKLLIKKDMKKFLKTIIKNDSDDNLLKSKNIKGVKKNGDIFYVDVFVEINYLYGDRYFNIICQDNTDKFKIEDLYFNLNNQVEIYNSIFENVHSGIAILDCNYNFVKTNKQLALFLGYSDEELLDKKVLDLIEKDSKNELEKLLNELTELIKVIKIEKIFIKKDGTQIHLELSLRFLREKEQIIFIVNSLEDKRELQELNLNLETRIKQELEKGKAKDKVHLEEQIKSAKLSYIGTLAAGITHEINTPLTYIKGNLELMLYDIYDLENGAIKERMLHDSKKMQDGINRIANIVESMREVTHSKVSNKEKINLCQTISTSLTMAHNRAKHISKIYINDKLVDLDSGFPINQDLNIFGQKQKLEQVWIIIINNALDELEKIADYDKRWLKLEINDDSDYINIKFKDSAGGISQEAMKKLFEPFNSQKEKGGMGIGLSIAKNIIEENGGEIDAYNGEYGAVFEVKLEKYKKEES